MTLPRSKCLRSFLIACVFILSAGATSGEAGGDVPPNIVKVQPDAAPSGAIIETEIRYPAGSPISTELGVEVGGVVAEITQSDESRVFAVVPKPEDPMKLADGPYRVPIKLIYNRGAGEAFNGFTLLPSLVRNSVPEISAIEWASVEEKIVQIRFASEIPVDQWGLVYITFDGLRVEKIIRMYPQLFTVILSRELRNKPSYNVVVSIGAASSIGVFRSGIGDEQQSNDWTFTLYLTLAALLIALVVIFWLIKRRKAKPRAVRSSESAQTEGPKEASRPVAEEPLAVEPAAEETERLRLPEELPSELVEACMAGDCVLYAGAGLGAQSGLPTWRDFVRSLVGWALENHFINDENAHSYRLEIDAGQSDPVADSILSRLTTQEDQLLLHNYLEKVFLGTSPSALHSLLKRIKFSAVLTANFDNLLESVYEIPLDQAYTPKDAELLLTALTRRDFFILKLYGTLVKPETVIVAPAQYEAAIEDNRLFAQFMETLFFSRTLLFIGASLEGIEAYLEGISLPRNIARKHCALVGVSGHAWRAKAEFLERRYGIKVLPYTPSDNHPELVESLTRLAETVAAGASKTADDKRKTSRLKRLHLENIGPFETLDLEFDPKWNVFLGDNGVGKSTILKAIALAISGEKAQPYASRLLRRDASSRITEGKIILETDNRTSYATTIRIREGGDEAEIISTTARPLEAEGWLALGFPPLRTTSWELLKGPEAEIRTRSRPAVEDLLPLVKGDVDPRLDKLKQWVVNLDYLKLQSETGSQGQGNHYVNLVNELFKVINSVTEGMTLRYSGVEKGTNRILIKTDDGAIVSLEALSQGIISLIGWVGILMQRLYEVFDKDDNPTDRYALILMDEVDAHMHPEWQRIVVNRLKDTFPEAQFIVTTHSPLVVGGMSASQVTRFARDKSGKVVCPPVAPDMTLGYTDQILTSMLFGLSTTLDDTTEQKMQRYYELYEMQDRSGHEQEYERLKRELMVRVPPPSASYEEKREEQLSGAEILRQLGEQLKEQSPDGGQLLLDRAEAMRKNIIEGSQSDDSN